MARKGLPGKYLKAAWKTKGATKKNALKRAWALFHKAGGTSKSRSSGSKTKTRKKNNPIRRRRNLARKKRGPRKFTLPIAVLGGLAAGLAPGIQMAVDGDYEGAIKNVVGNYTG